MTMIMSSFVNGEGREGGSWCTGPMLGGYFEGELEVDENKMTNKVRVGVGE